MLLLLLLSDLFSLQLIDLSQHLSHLLLSQLLVLDSVQLSLLNLVDNHERTLLLSLLPLDLSFFLHFERLESFDLHHDVQSLLLFDPLRLQSLGLLLLLVSDGHDLAVKHHLVHVLHIVVLLVKHLLGLSQQGLVLLLLQLLVLGRRDLVAPVLVHLDHALLPLLGSCELLVALLLK